MYLRSSSRELQDTPHSRGTKYSIKDITKAAFILHKEYYMILNRRSQGGILVLICCLFIFPAKRQFYFLDFHALGVVHMQQQSTVYSKAVNDAHINEVLRSPSFIKEENFDLMKNSKFRILHRNHLNLYDIILVIRIIVNMVFFHHYRCIQGSWDYR
jgi:hypothetical protein